METKTSSEQTPDTDLNVKSVSVRYIVNNVNAAIDFYTKLLNFKLEMHPTDEFAIVSRENLRLLLSKPGEHGGGGQQMPDGTRQVPGGWNRIHIDVDDIESIVMAFREAGCSFRNDMVEGVGGKQILLLDPSGNLIELFEYFESSSSRPQTKTG
jgi:catechol 2,3-dioxygenase-like lactoylglutathione lyase family enzyme